MCGAAAQEASPLARVAAIPQQQRCTIFTEIAAFDGCDRKAEQMGQRDQRHQTQLRVGRGRDWPVVDLDQDPVPALHLSEPIAEGEFLRRPRQFTVIQRQFFTDLVTEHPI